MDKISLLCPTRNRPANVDRLVESCLLQAAEPWNVEFVFYIDDDDRTTLTAKVFKEYSNYIKKQIGPRIVLSEMWNRCYEIASGPYYWHMGDDIIFRTRNWDTLIRQAFDKYPDKIALVFGDDGGPRGKEFATHSVLHENWIKTVGYFVPPYFSSDYNDTWLRDVASAIGRYVCIPELLTEHMHFEWGKSEIDSTHRERLKRHAQDDVAGIYERKAKERDRDAEKLRAFIKERALIGDSADPGDQSLVWSILVTTVPKRNSDLTKLLDVLLPQVEEFGGQIEVVVYSDDCSLPVGEKRQKLMEGAEGEYISFVDDDDMVADGYCKQIMAKLANKPDYVGFRMQLYIDGVAQKPTFHSLQYTRWFENSKGYYRNISHLNPIRKSLALLGTFSGQFGEDKNWADQIAATGLVKQQEYIPDCMYHYYWVPKRSLTTNDPNSVPGEKGYKLPESPYMRYI